LTIFSEAIFGAIKVGDFVEAPSTRKVQNIASRKISLEYITSLSDYDVLSKLPDKEFYGLSYTEHTLVAGDRLDNLSFTYYNDSDFWWVLSMFNKIIDPFELTQKTLKIPIRELLMIWLTDKVF